MSRLLEVKEFDKITCNPDYQNDSSYKYLEEQVFNYLIRFIEEFVATENNDDALLCLKTIYQRGPGRVVSTKNYVGLIQMKNGYQIEILPKISFGNSNDINSTKTKETFLNMLRCMKEFNSKVFSVANLNVDKMNLYEIFINIYIQEVSNLTKHGLKSSYVSENDNLSTLKGKLDIKNNATKNVIHQEKFCCIFDEYQVNRPENRLIKSTLLKLNTITERIENKKSIGQLLNYFEMVDESLNFDLDFSKVSIDRSMKDYELVIRWSKIFLKNKSFTTFSGDSVSRALLFQMDKLFEAYVANNMKKVLSETNWTVSAQDKGFYLFNEPTNQFALRPDLVITRDDGSKIIMDTKWKKLDSSKKNYAISESDMYQMYAYSKKYGTSEIWLLYPLNDEMRNYNPITFKSNDDVIINVYFVDVTDIQTSLKDLCNKL